MSDSVRPHRWQPTRLPCPWDSPGKNTRVGCHFLLQCMKVKSKSEVAQSCLTLSDPMDYSPPGCFIHGIFQARVLEWGATAFSKGSPRTCKLYRLSWAYSTKWEKYLSIIYLSSNIWDIVALNIIFIIILWVKFIVDFSFSVPVCSEPVKLRL